MTFSGRRPTGRAKGFLRAIGEGLDALGTAMSDGPKLTRIKEIDEQVKNLLQERDHLVHGLIDSYEGYEVSENYDPSWKKPESSSDDEDESLVNEPGVGRWIKCEGRDTSSRYHKAHVDCPHIEKLHNPHEFFYRY